MFSGFSERQKCCQKLCPCLFSGRRPDDLPQACIIWLHGLGDSGPDNEPIKYTCTSREFDNIKWAFPTANSMPVTCNRGLVMPSWFDIYEMPITSKPQNSEEGVLDAVQRIHSMIDNEIAAGVRPENIFVCGLSQGGATTLASVLLYPKTLGGGAIFSGWVPFKPSIAERIPDAAKKTPILWAHGKLDRTVLFEAGEAAPPFLQALGIVSCEFKVYPDLGHTLTDEELLYLEAWIKERLKSH